MSAAAECSTDSLGAVFDRREEGMSVWVSEAWGRRHARVAGMRRADAAIAP